MAKMAPCKDCTDRVLLCHSTCEKYLTWKEKRDAEHKIIIENRLKNAQQIRRRNDAIRKFNHNHKK